MPKLANPLSPKSIGLECSGGVVIRPQAAAGPDPLLLEEKMCYNHHLSHLFSGNSFRL